MTFFSLNYTAEKVTSADKERNDESRFTWLFLKNICVTEKCEIVN